MRGFSRALLPAFLVLAALAALAQNELPPQPAKKNAKLCVAIVGNASTTPALEERMTARLVQTLKDMRVNVEGMDSRTTMQHRITMTSDNSAESRDKECDYVLLTQLTEPRLQPNALDMPTIQIGKRAPNVDASGPLDSTQEQRESLEVVFVMFRNGRLKPVVDTSVPAYSIHHVAEDFLPAMDREASRIAREFNKK